MTSLEEKLHDVVAHVAEVSQKLQDIENQSKGWTACADKIAKGLEPRVKLNVGGMKFITSCKTLKSQSGSYFDALLSGRWEVSTKETIFIDHDGTMFKYILDFMRGDDLDFHLLSPPEFARLKKDAEYFQLNNLLSILSSPQINLVFSNTLKSPSVTVAGDNVTIAQTGHAAVLGEDEYISGAHLFKFSIVNCGHWLFFGIGREPLIDDNSYSLPNSYGWAGLDQVYVGGQNHNSKDGYTTNMQTGDIICLLLDCDGRSLLLWNETDQSKPYSLQLPVSKWRIHLNLYNPGDSIKMISKTKL